MTPAETLWKMPAAATAITRDPTFMPLPQRQCEIAYWIESEAGDEKASLVFGGVGAYRCTDLSALSADMITAAYGSVVDLGRTPWLAEISERAARWYSLSKIGPPRLKHLAICFDDGPSYEFICSEFSPPR